MDEAWKIEEEPSTSTKGNYRKELGTWHVILLAIGAILGPAIAYAPVYTVAYAGPSGIIAWPLAMLMIIPLGLIYSELGTMWPKAGGVAYYPSKSNGPLVGAINGWSSFVGYILVGPVIVFAVVEYLSYYFPSFYSSGNLTYLGIVIAEVILVLVFIVNILRIKHMGDINLILTLVTVSLIAVMLIGLSFFFRASNLNSPALGGFTPYGYTGLFGAITLTVFGFGGFRQPIDYAAEIKNPGRSIPLAVIISIIISGLIFTLEALFFAGAVRFSAFGITSGNWGAFTSYGSPYASEAKVLALPVIVVVSIIVALIATFKDGVIYYGGAARVTQQLAKEDHYLPRIFDRINKHGIPIYAVFLVLIVVVILLALGRSLATIIGVMVDGLLVSYAPGCVSLMVFRKTDPDVKRPFRLPAAKILAPIGFVVANLLVFWSGWSAIQIIMPLDLVGALLVIIYSRYTKVDFKYLSYGVWLPIYFLAIIAISYIGSSFFGGTNIIPFPYDSVVFIIVTLVFYYLGVELGIRSNKFMRSGNHKTTSTEKA